MQTPGITLPSDLCQDCGNFVSSSGSTNLRDLPLAVLEARYLEGFRDALLRHSTVREILSDDPIGILHVDVPDVPGDLAKSLLYTTALFHLVNSALYSPLLDSGNSLPYTVYKCSADNAAQMKAAGIRFYSPNEKLGFHNDVFHDSGTFEIPRFVSLVNLFIGYRKPGSFHYVDKREWDALPDLMNRGIDRSFLFRPTPIVYESRLKNVEGLDEWRAVRAFWRNERNEPFAFSNGELRGTDDEGNRIIADLKSSLLNNSRRWSSEQRPGRIFVFRNDVGFHSRDIFEEQYVMSGVTRLFLRSVSNAAVRIPPPMERQSADGRSWVWVDEPI